MGNSRSWISGIAGLYTDSDSWAEAAFQKAYLQDDRTRVTAGVGRGSFNLDFYGVGATAGDRDTRDSELKPHRGSYSSLEAYVAREGIGSDFDYEKATLACNHYWPVGEDSDGLYLSIGEAF